MPNYVGKSIPRVDALAKVTGKALFPGDFEMDNQAYLKILFAGRPHAIIHKIDTREAEAYPGVLAVLTAKDVPVNEYGLNVKDQPVLCGPGSTKANADHVCFYGDNIALVIAESEEIASEALKLIKVEFEDLPTISTIYEALKEDAIKIHPEKNDNIFRHYRIRKGDVDEAFKKADVIIESDYETPAQEHAYLQPEAGIGYIDEEGRVTVVVGGQWTHEDREQVAHALDLPEEKVRIIYPAIGGAFGGREDMSVQIVLGLAALYLNRKGINRPVKIVWSREESIIGHHKRHPYFFHAKWGATKEGKVIAAEVDIKTDGGAYIYTSTKVMGNATLMCTGPYEIPNIKVDSYAIYTNNIPNGAFRGFGGPQGAFEAECQMNKLAEALHIDPVEIRKKNLLREKSLLSVGTPIPPGVSIEKVVEKTALSGGWKNENNSWMQDPKKKLTNTSDKYLHRGRGFACAFKNVGFSFGAPESCTAIIELHGKEKIEKVIVRHAGAEVGQGSHTVFKQMAADALNIPIEKVQLTTSDTASTENSGSVSASRMTFMAGNSIRGAAQMALSKWENEERPAISTYTYYPPKTTPYDPETGKCEPNFSYGYVAEVADVEVNTETGQIKILNVICGDDVGKAINPQLVAGQVEGAVVQAAGYTLLEKFIQKNGYVETRTLSTYLIPTILDVPDQIQSVILEYPDPIGPYGARGMGEMPFLPLAGAIIAAVHDATGIWFNRFPLTPEEVLKGLGKI
ncbi:xanthine dehydrogenase family protein molybdopterin-binding subunit [Leptolinea tardivitalis]|uniref:Aldehyde oxidase n=1 Tax=Leptolinea tardivitalis TaxID=229920 RepID=A0A0P6XH49_9CHLR|nr:xanthine dehydrogenase family protein molybdopterin-binding subunit [Leptolinea tardivitalis]KPL74685.1 aldehyde oxidase [Leptolinea tardivitalis]GAP22967.1 xanthine dehydrogenase, molybdenum binding subunit apoprotein [Leptolinea tardivitalis]